MAQQRDTILYYETPEGVQIAHHLAGPLVRGTAWCIDFAIRIICYLIAAAILAFFGGFGTALTLIGLFFIEWFYYVFFEVYNGMSPGKRAMEIKVIHDDGTPVSWSSSLLRNLLRSIDLLPFFNIAGFLTMQLNGRFKRIGDLAAGTVVVYETVGNTARTIPKYPARPAPVPLTLDEQRLILDFCERAEELTSSRRNELANILNDFSQDDTPENALLAYGNWFLKGKNDS